MRSRPIALSAPVRHREKRVVEVVRPATPTALARVLNGAYEAAWLYVLAAVPTFFSLAQTRNYDLVKTVYLRASVAFLVFVVALELVLDEELVGATRTFAPVQAWRRLGSLQRGLCTAAGLVLVSLAIATATSLVPRISLVGSHLRNHGLFTEAVHVALFACIVIVLRRRKQVSRLLDCVIATVAVSSWYSLVQMAHLDPLDQALADRGSAISAFTGNTLFFGGLLVVAACAAGGRFVAAMTRHPADVEDLRGFEVAAGSLLGLFALLAIFVSGLYTALPWWILPLTPVVWLAPVASERRARPTWWTVRHDAWVYGGLCALMIVLVLRTDSRTHWVALAVGLFVQSVITTRRRRIRLAMLSVSATILVFAALVLASGIEGSPLAGLREAPVVGSALSIAGRRTSVQGRFEIWREVLTLVGSTNAANSPRDPVPEHARAVVGFGPGVLYTVLDAFATPERMQYEAARIDRAHNEFLERLSSGGALTLVTWVAFLAVQVGIVSQYLRSRSPSQAGWMLGVLGGALSGQIVADSFGPGDPQTRLYVWIVAAVICSQGFRSSGSGAQGSLAQSGKTRDDGLADGVEASNAARQWHPWVVAGGTAATVVCGAAVAFPMQIPASFTLYFIASAVSMTLAVMLLGFCLGHVSMIQSSRPRTRRASFLQIAGLFVLAIGGSLLSWRVIRPLEADLYNRAAVQSVSTNSPVTGVELARWSIGISPNEELYYMTLATSLAEIGRVMPIRTSTLPGGPSLQVALDMPTPRMSLLSRQDFYDLAEVAFRKAAALNPYDIAHQRNLEALRQLREETLPGGPRP